MPLINIFVCMALICLGVSTLCTLYGWVCYAHRNLPGAERAFYFAKDAWLSMAGFGTCALFGLLFI
jgi:hypothetical protein